MLKSGYVEEMSKDLKNTTSSHSDDKGKAKPTPSAPTSHEPEIGGRKGPEPTRYGDWEKKGLISDF